MDTSNMTTLERRFYRLMSAIDVQSGDHLNIVVEQNYECCNTCGSVQMSNDYNNDEHDYLGYMFYHEQENDNIMDQLKNNKTLIEVRMAWGPFDSYIEKHSLSQEQAQNKMMKLIKSLNTDGIKVTCTDIKRKIIFELDLSSDVDKDRELGNDKTDELENCKAVETSKISEKTLEEQKEYVLVL